MTRSLWMLLAFVLAVGVPFYVFGVAGLDFFPALSASLVAWFVAAWAVRQSVRAAERER